VRVAELVPDAQVIDYKRSVVWGKPYGKGYFGGATLVVLHTDPLVLRIAINHYTLFRGSTIYKPFFHPRGEISILPDEVGAFAEWTSDVIMACSSMTHVILPVPPHPFVTEIKVLNPDLDLNISSNIYVWSQAARDAYNTSLKRTKI
jgi:hypothetical protein